MERKFITMDFNEWVQKYKPLYKRSGLRYEYNGLLNTMGHEYDRVRLMSTLYPNHLWTLIDNCEYQFINNGWHFVDRLGYYVTEKPFNPDYLYQVDICESTE